MKFGTLINCTDGRVQYPVMDYLQRAFGKDKTYVGLYVNEVWVVEEFTKFPPEI